VLEDGQAVVKGDIDADAQLGLPGGGGEIPEPAGPLPTIDEEKGLVTDPATDVAAVKAPRSILHALPTPSRGRASLQAAELASAATTVRSGAKGPEPWNHSSTASQPGQRGGYRELLQLRGQQAMQRSLKQGLVNRTTAQASPSGGTASPVSQMPSQASPPAMPWSPAAAASGLQLQQWLGAQALVSSATQQPQMVPGCGQQLPLVFGGCPQTPTPSPVAGQQSPGAFASCPQQQLVFGACHQLTPSTGSQASPATFSDCSQGSTPLAGQQMLGFGDCSQGTTPVAGQQPQQLVGFADLVHGHQQAFAPDCTQGSASSSGQQELMATLMPDASCFNREQIAEQLRAAVPCCYDD
jgi:hypothetical protein